MDNSELLADTAILLHELYQVPDGTVYNLPEIIKVLIWFADTYQQNLDEEKHESSLE